MSQIRHVVLTDVHFGAGNSVLTHFIEDGTITDPSQPSSTLVALVDCLRELFARDAAGAQGPKPTLVLNGDALDLALSNVADASMAFDRFLELAFPKDGEALFDSRIVYIPGNHDHHLWEVTRQLEYMQKIGTLPLDKLVPAESHSTPIFAEPTLPTQLVTQLLHRHPHLADARVDTAYPAYGLLSADKQRAVVMSHGHYIESLYHLMSALMNALFPARPRPRTLEHIQNENYAWIDFFWGTLGRSGDAGRGVELIYEKLQDEKAMRQLLHNAAAYLARQQRDGVVTDWVEEQILSRAFDWAWGHMQKRERLQTDDVLSDDAKGGLATLVEGPLRGAVVAEIGAMPADFTFLFGHTHKPYEAAGAFPGYDQVKLYNSGGWAIDTAKPDRTCGGAVLLIDSDLHVASLRMFNIGTSAADYHVHVAAADGMRNPLYNWLKNEIDPTKAPWKDFSRIVAEAVARRASALEVNIATSL